MARLIPVAYKVGGRHVSEPTGPDRDSSLRISKAPGISCSCREAQIATDRYRAAMAPPPEKSSCLRGRSCLLRVAARYCLRKHIACALKERPTTSPTRI